MLLRSITPLRFPALLLVFLCCPTYADTWNYGTTVSLNSDWNDNIALANDVLEPQSTFRFLASYEGQFERQGNDSSFRVRPRVTTDYYPDSEFSDLQSTDFFLPGSFVYSRPLRTWSLGFSASQQSVLSDEATTSQQTPLGSLQGDDTLTQFALTPSLVWRLSEKDELQLGLNYSTSDYDLEFTNRADTDSVGANLTYRRNVNERHAIGASGFFSSSDGDRRALIPVQVDPPTNPPTFVVLEGKVRNDSTSSFLTANYDYAVSTSSILSISYGIQDATTESKTELVGTGQTRSTGSLNFSSSTFDIVYEARTERGRYNFGVNRTVTLDITNGQPQDRYQINFDGDYKLTERVLAEWRLLAWTQEAIALEALDQNNLPIRFSSKLTYASTEFRLNYNLTRKWYITSRYEYRWRDTDQSINNVSQDQRATSNQVTLGFTYIWKELPRR